ncbi:MAG: UDP-3-O-(3-hydroxymyristoyl)glucosamine N-acyltransferase [Rhizobiaceae bacterium]
MTDPVFFAPTRPYTAAELAELTGAKLANPADASVEITGLSSISEGGQGRLIYVDGKRNAATMKSLVAAAILCPPEFAADVPKGIAQLLTTSPQRAFALVGRTLYPGTTIPGRWTDATGVSPHAYVASTATVEAGAIVEAGASIGPGAAVGAGTVISPNAVIGPGCHIGRDGYVGPGATIQCALIGNRVSIHQGASIGQDGFGFVAGPRGPERIPHIGRVIIQDDVEIGANSTVDRGTLGDTVIGEGTKIDNLVQIAHNVRVGRFCFIAGHCGLSGSVTLADGVMLGGRVGIADHVSIGAGAQIAASSGLMHDVPAGERWAGSPARPVREFFREVAAIRSLIKPKDRKGDRDG